MDTDKEQARKIANETLAKNLDLSGNIPYQTMQLNTHGYMTKLSGFDKEEATLAAHIAEKNNVAISCVPETGTDGTYSIFAAHEYTAALTAIARQAKYELSDRDSPAGAYYRREIQFENYKADVLRNWMNADMPSAEKKYLVSVSSRKVYMLDGKGIHTVNGNKVRTLSRGKEGTKEREQYEKYASSLLKDAGTSMILTKEEYAQFKNARFSWQKAKIIRKAERNTGLMRPQMSRSEVEDLSRKYAFQKGIQEEVNKKSDYHLEKDTDLTSGEPAQKVVYEQTYFDDEMKLACLHTAVVNSKLSGSRTAGKTQQIGSKSDAGDAPAVRADWYRHFDDHINEEYRTEEDLHRYIEQTKESLEQESMAFETNHISETVFNPVVSKKSNNGREYNYSNEQERVSGEGHSYENAVDEYEFEDEHTNGGMNEEKDLGEDFWGEDREDHDIDESLDEDRGEDL